MAAIQGFGMSYSSTTVPTSQSSSITIAGSYGTPGTEIRDRIDQVITAEIGGELIAKFTKREQDFVEDLKAVKLAGEAMDRVFNFASLQKLGTEHIEMYIALLQNFCANKLKTITNEDCKDLLKTFESYYSMSVKILPRKNTQLALDLFFNAATKINSLAHLQFYPGGSGADDTFVQNKDDDISFTRICLDSNHNYLKSWYILTSYHFNGLTFELKNSESGFSIKRENDEMDDIPLENVSLKLPEALLEFALTTLKFKKEEFLLPKVIREVVGVGSHSIVMDYLTKPKRQIVRAAIETPIPMDTSLTA